jgi:hypothetical protein
LKVIRIWRTVSSVDSTELNGLKMLLIDDGGFFGTHGIWGIGRTGANTGFSLLPTNLDTSWIVIEQQLSSCAIPRLATGPGEADKSYPGIDIVEKVIGSPHSQPVHPDGL